MIKVSEELTRQVAALARLELSEEEVRTFTPQLKDILGYVDQLSEINLIGAEPMTQPFLLDMPFRDDSPADINGQPKMLQGAPDLLNNSFKVPSIL